MLRSNQAGPLKIYIHIYTYYPQRYRTVAMRPREKPGRAVNPSALRPLGLIRPSARGKSDRSPRNSLEIWPFLCSERREPGCQDILPSAKVIYGPFISEKSLEIHCRKKKIISRCQMSTLLWLAIQLSAWTAGDLLRLRSVPPGRYAELRACFLCRHGDGVSKAISCFRLVFNGATLSGSFGFKEAARFEMAKMENYLVMRIYGLSRGQLKRWCLTSDICKNKKKQKKVAKQKRC